MRSITFDYELARRLNQYPVYNFKSISNVLYSNYITSWKSIHKIISSITVPLPGEAAEREAGLQRARDTTAAIDKRLNDLMAWLEDQEEYLKSCGPVADTYDGLVEQLGEHKVGFEE